MSAQKRFTGVRACAYLRWRKRFVRLRGKSWARQTLLTRTARGTWAKLRRGSLPCLYGGRGYGLRAACVRACDGSPMPCTDVVCCRWQGYAGGAGCRARARIPAQPAHHPPRHQARQCAAHAVRWPRLHTIWSVRQWRRSPHPEAGTELVLCQLLAAVLLPRLQSAPAHDCKLRRCLPLRHR